jgi:hypothetical protein
VDVTWQVSRSCIGARASTASDFGGNGCGSGQGVCESEVCK